MFCTPEDALAYRAVVGKWGKAYAIDLLGYGYSDKPTPSKSEPNTIYNFENWAGALRCGSCAPPSALPGTQLRRRRRRHQCKPWEHAKNARA